MKIFLLRKRYLLIALALVLAGAMLLAACLPELLAGAPLAALRGLTDCGIL